MEPFESRLKAQPLRPPSKEFGQPETWFALRANAPTEGAARPWSIRRRWKSPVAALVGLAAAAALFYALWSGATGSSVAFAQVAKRLRDARTLTYDSVSTSVADGKVLGKSRHYCMLPGKCRQEFLYPDPEEEACNILDVPAGKSISLLKKQQVAIVAQVRGKAPFDPAREMIEFIQSEPEAAARRLEEKEIDGVRAVGFESDFPDGKTIVWANAKTGDPLRIENLFNKSVNVPGQELEVMTNFKLNRELDPALFNTEPPPGYKIRPNITLDLDATAPDYLVNLLKIYARHMDGEFPANLGVGTLDAINKKLEETGKVKPGELPAEDDLLQLPSFEAAINGRILPLPRGERWQYYPGGKLGQKDRLIFWYLNSKTNKYAGVFGDLRIETLSKEQLPPVKDAPK